MIFERQTLDTDLTFEGPGLHRGEPTRVVISGGNEGIQFRQGSNRIEAIPENVSDTSRCTRLGDIGVIEHLMSALAAAGITDAEIEVTGCELPAADGCAGPYIQALLAAPRKALRSVEVEGLFARVYEKSETHSVAIGRGEGWWRYEFLTGDRWPGVQDFELKLNPETYAQEIAPARTFCFAEELPHLEQAGLGQGLDATTALVLGVSGYENEARFPEEPARHKLLDLIGDLYLAGLPPQFLNVVAERSGHRANVAAAAKLRSAVRVQAAG